ncbi:TIGR03621 family F420-dependent LLM class oxidoreductase [Streptomyces spiralis]|uniref:TIGR03621 family F420-dependent LLM class oxidoreductase n=1 Tax=Streptomyces spiralis TaxID=66376 RepID=UPI0036B4B3D8
MRFSYSVSALGSSATFAERCRSAERAGFDVLFVADHLDGPAPFAMLAAAACATDELRVGTLVLNSAFWTPRLLVREARTLNELSGGRVELGLGAGYLKREFQEAGIPWEGAARRARRLDETVRDVRHMLAAADGGTAAPRLAVGGMSEQVLRTAARRADTVSLSGLFQVRKAPAGTFRLATAEETAARVRYVREQAGERAASLELNALVQMVVPCDDRRAVAERLTAGPIQEMTADELLSSPFALLGTVAEMAEQLRRHRAEFGLGHVTVYEPFRDVFARVIAALRDDEKGTGG